jgi:hypothetical protein
MSCPTLSFDCSQEKFEALKAQLQTEGITIAANVGLQTARGITVSWAYYPDQAKDPY